MSDKSQEPSHPEAGKKPRSEAQRAHTQRLAEAMKAKAADRKAGKAPGVPQDVSICPLPGVGPAIDPTDLYAAMRAVLTPGVKPRTPLERVCKQAMRDNPSKFIDKFEELQAKYQKIEVTAEKEKPVQDEATERCLEHLERLLARHREGI